MCLCLCQAKSKLERHAIMTIVEIPDTYSGDIAASERIDVVGVDFRLFETAYTRFVRGWHTVAPCSSLGQPQPLPSLLSVNAQRLSFVHKAYIGSQLSFTISRSSVIIIPSIHRAILFKQPLDLDRESTIVPTVRGSSPGIPLHPQAWAAQEHKTRMWSQS